MHFGYGNSQEMYANCISPNPVNIPRFKIHVGLPQEKHIFANGKTINQSKMASLPIK